MSRGLCETLEDIKDVKENTCYVTNQVIEILKLVELRKISGKLAEINMALEELKKVQ